MMLYGLSAVSGPAIIAVAGLVDEADAGALGEYTSAVTCEPCTLRRCPRRHEEVLPLSLFKATYPSCYIYKQRSGEIYRQKIDVSYTILFQSSLSSCAHDLGRRLRKKYGLYNSTKEKGEYGRIGVFRSLTHKAQERLAGLSGVLTRNYTTHGHSCDFGRPVDIYENRLTFLSLQSLSFRRLIYDRKLFFFVVNDFNDLSLG
ncbi:unnamed protein product [Bursaphelenchus xylophilus]|uniref:(pine wood nematode) hypothetical protein n=1 Tax=Bursaphelenchus xylophilus TaxID=6326 RepID=A0A7I8WZ68_BURXY|nr:unnamed protein product [Bursaphelenchus xylophilus]CAG9102040.1 unnamed protein product [Bursaphelenchus xylophilus]